MNWVLWEEFHLKRRDKRGEESSRERLRHVQGREVKERGLFWEPGPPLHGRRPGFTCGRGVILAWQFEHQPEGEGGLYSIRLGNSIFFSRQ